MSSGPDPDLTNLRWEALRGSPRRAVALGRACDGDEATWLLGVSLGATGRYGEAYQALTSIATVSPLRSLADSTSASLLRQVGRHADAQVRDFLALERASTPTDRFDALLGLSADAVGLGDHSLAAARWDEASSELRNVSDPWRQTIRLGWVEAELALLDDRPVDAAVAAERSVSLSVQAGAERHRAKSLLFEGVARADCGDVPAAVLLLRRSMTLSERLGAWPLVWPAAMVAARHLGGAEALALERRSAVVVTAINARLPRSTDS